MAAQDRNTMTIGGFILYLEDTDGAARIESKSALIDLLLLCFQYAYSGTSDNELPNSEKPLIMK